MSGDRPQYPSYPGDDGGDAQPPSQPPPPPPPPGTPQTPQPAYGSTQPEFPPPDFGGVDPAYASWSSRFGAYFLDGLFAMLGFLPLFVAGVATAEATGVGGELNPDTGLYEGGTVSPLSPILVVLSYVFLVVFMIWNYAYRQGRTGQTVGKQIVKIRVIREQTPDTPLGFWLAVGRYLLFSILTSCTLYINALWPLWDSKRQALHDKVVSTVVVKT